ncbi:MAG: ABC transporter permease [Spirochaetaceae bacterium]
MGDALLEAGTLILSGDRELIAIALNSVHFSVFSTLITSALAIPAGTVIALRDFPGRQFLVSTLNTLMAVPTVVVGLFVYSFLSRSGPLGHWGLLFTPAAVIVGQAALALPLVTALVYGGLSRIDAELSETLVTFGASPVQILFKILSEARIAILSAVLSGFGRVIGEVGVSMMLGGNIRWYTRTMTTALALETQKGAFALALALGMILLIIAFAVNAALNWMVNREYA